MSLAAAELERAAKKLQSLALAIRSGDAAPLQVVQDVATACSDAMGAAACVAATAQRTAKECAESRRSACGLAHSPRLVQLRRANLRSVQELPAEIELSA